MFAIDAPKTKSLLTFKKLKYCHFDDLSGRKLEDVFSEFEEKPIGSASIGQVRLPELNTRYPHPAMMMPRTDTSLGASCPAQVEWPACGGQGQCVVVKVSVWWSRSVCGGQGQCVVAKVSVW